jgi:hypothetical protein
MISASHTYLRLSCLRTRVKSMHVLYITMTYDRGRFKHLALLSLSSSDDSYFRFLLLGAESSIGEVGDVLCDDAEEKSESEPSESDELDDSTVTRR